MSPLQVTQMRVLGAALVAGAVLFILDRRSFRVPRDQRLALVVMGVVGVGMLQAAYALAVELLPVGIALLLEFLAVPMVAVFAFVVFKERVRTRIWVSIGLIMAGLAVVAQIWNSSLNLVGTLWALLAALSLSTYFLVGEKQMETISPLALMFWSMTIAAVFWAFMSGWWRLDPSMFAQSVPLTGVLEGVPAPMWMLLLWNVVMGSFAPFLLSLAAIKKLSATAAGIAATSEIVFAFFVAWLWIGENLSGSQIIGAAVVLSGIIVAQTARRSPVPITADLAMETGPIVLPVIDDVDEHHS